MLLSIDYVAEPARGRTWLYVWREARYQVAGRTMTDGLELDAWQEAWLAGFAGSELQPGFHEAVERTRARLELAPVPARWAAAVVYHALRRLRGTTGRRGPESVIFDLGPASVRTAVLRQDRDAVLATLRGIEAGDYAPARFYLSWEPLCQQGELAELGERLRREVVP